MTRWIALWTLLVGTAVAQSPGAGTVSGRLTRLDASPLSGVRVAAMATPSVPNNQGNDVSASVLVSTTRTGNDGRYRLENVRPGSYYIIAGPVARPAYYPGVTDTQKAAMITVKPGAVLDKIDFVIPDTLTAVREVTLADLTGTAEGNLFDMTRSMTMRGIITKAPNLIPGSTTALTVYANVKDIATGLITNWTIFAKQGSKQNLRIGEQINFTGFGAKDGAPTIVVESAIEIVTGQRLSIQPSTRP